MAVRDVGGRVTFTTPASSAMNVNNDDRLHDERRENEDVISSWVGMKRPSPPDKLHVD